MTRVVVTAAGVLAALAFAAGFEAAARPGRPAPPAAAAPPVGEPTTAYVVKKGDTLWGLGDKYFLRRPTFEEVRIRNGVRYVRRLRVGLELTIPTRLLKIEPIDAVVGAFRGQVSISGGGTQGAPRLGATVREGALIATGANAFIRLDLPDGSRVSVPSQSRLRIASLHRVLLSGAVERTFAVEQGRSESVVAPITSPQDNYLVRTPVSVSAVRGTDFRVAYDEAGQTASTGVVEGTVKVEGQESGAAAVTAGFGAGVKAGSLLAVTPLLPAPALRNPGRLQDGPSAAFEIEPVEGARTYRIQLAVDAGMLDVFSEQTQTDPHFTFEGLADGDYFLRVTAIDGGDIEGLPRVYAFTRDLNTIAATAAERGGGGGDRRFLFKWQAQGEGERTYRFQLSREPSDEASYIDEGGLKDTAVTVVNLPPGRYRWRVMSATARDGGLVQKWSAPQTFIVPAN